jgi:hypothetical protein
VCYLGGRDLSQPARLSFLSRLSSVRPRPVPSSKGISTKTRRNQGEHTLLFVGEEKPIYEAPARRRTGSGGRTDALVEEVLRRVSEQERVRIPREVLEELEAVRRYTRAEVLDIPTIRHVAMERGKPALVVWIDKHQQEYGQGLLNGFWADD